jgi:hypothetical protein
MPIGPTPQLKAGLFGRRGPGAPPAGKVVAPAPKGPSGVRIEHRIGIHAPASVIWEIVHDLGRWPEWNPLFVRAEGAIRIGGPLNLTQALPGQPPRELQATVLEWVPDEQLHWRTSAMGGLMRSIHYIEIEALAEENCIVSNGEIVGGLLSRGAVRQSGGLLRRGLTQMNEALKARAEAAWRTGANAPTSGTP